MSTFLEANVGLLARKKHQEKLKHVNACLLSESQYQKSAGFDEIDLVNQSAAGLDLDGVSLSTTFLGKDLRAPLMIAPMTGGTELGATLNRRWAQACEHFGLGLGIGSQRLALIKKDVEESFMVRKYAPTALLFSNIGVAQLLEEGASDLALRAVGMIEADALFIHLNPLQEACKHGGDKSFVGLLRSIEGVVHALRKRGIKVLVREVGFGLSEEAARSLMATGIDGLDCAGAGGTSWTKVEAMCSVNDRYRRLAMAFKEWGIPTARSILNVRQVDKTIPLIATGGIRSGLDIAKAIALGADMAAIAQPILIAALKGQQEFFDYIDEILLELRVAMYASGATDVDGLKGKAIQSTRT